MPIEIAVFCYASIIECGWSLLCIVQKLINVMDDTNCIGNIEKSLLKNNFIINAITDHKEAINYLLKKV
jgi:hypothetical protein